MPEPLATAAQVAKYLQKTEKTLANWRSYGLGPHYYKAEGTIRYRWSDVEAWLAGQSVAPGQKAG